MTRSGRPRRLVAANWKMHLVSAEARTFCQGLRDGLAESDLDTPQVAIFPSFPLLPTVVAALDGSEVAVGGQDVHPSEKGAHTGDVSAIQLADVGATWVICGHSERRRDHSEGDDLVGRKAQVAARHGLTPLLCVGETREERHGGRTEEVLSRQLNAAVSPLLGRSSELPFGPSSHFAVAYEPVWAIGTGEVATPEIASAAHVFLRKRLAEQVGSATAMEVPLLYGGSVAPENARELAVAPEVDGFLVGGASLDLSKFLAIIHSFRG
jgi:triosephosphate isomerase (TIM)